MGAIAGTAAVQDSGGPGAMRRWRMWGPMVTFG